MRQRIDISISDPEYRKWINRLAKDESISVSGLFWKLAREKIADKYGVQLKPLPERTYRKEIPLE